MELIEKASEEKLRGGYYTPADIASFIVKWALSENTNASILEPSCGDGAFLSSLKKSNLPFKHLTGVEYIAEEAAKAAAINLHNSRVVNEDFHKFCLSSKKKYDVIIGNPPYIRYQYYSEDQQDSAEKIFNKSGLKFSKLTNAWATFVVGCCQLLSSRGKLGFVVPAELLQVSYSAQLRKFLPKVFNKIDIISFKKLVFDGVLEDVVLLLCEKNSTKSHTINLHEVENAEKLKDFDINNPVVEPKEVSSKTDKWTLYFLDSEEIAFLERIKSSGFATISDFAEVEVGITTGANKFFTVSSETVKEYDLSKYAYPMVGRSVQVDSAIFTKKDWKKNNTTTARSNMLIFPEKDSKHFSAGVQRYLEKGVENEINAGYKTGIRDFWYVIPSIKLSDALFIRRNYLFPKLILNEASAYTTDTMHRVFIKEGVNHRAFIASYYNSLSLAFSEICGRNHGGGVLELMPSEVEAIVLPYSIENEPLLSQIDTGFRSGSDINGILDQTDKVILENHLGFTHEESLLARRIWAKMRDRRLSRAL